MADLQQAQQYLTANGAVAVGDLVNASNIHRQTDLSHVLNLVASVQLQLLALDCASFDCGPGVCTLMDSTPTCNCNGTEYVGSNCQYPANETIGGRSQGVYVCTIELYG